MNLFDTATPTGGESGTCKGACQDKYGSHYCMCNDELCSKYEEDRIAGTHECGGMYKHIYSNLFVLYLYVL